MNNEIFNVPLITGKTNSTIVKISKLTDKKYRKEEKLFMCDGIKLFLEAVDFDVRIKYIVLNNNVNFDGSIVEKIKKCQVQGTVIICAEEYVFSKLTSELSPQGIIIVCEYINGIDTFSTNVENINFDKECVMIFDSVRDPGNMGTIMRSAVAFGIDRIILSSDCVDVYSSKVIRSSMGALFKLKINVSKDLSQTVREIQKKGKRVLSTALKKNSLKLGKDKISRDDILVFGNEGHGVSDEIINICNDTVFIPIRENTESLNVAEAATILMWEISK